MPIGEDQKKHAASKRHLNWECEKGVWDGGRYYELLEGGEQLGRSKTVWKCTVS